MHSAVGGVAMSYLYCRCCGAEVKQSVLDLGLSPLANSYLGAEALKQGQMFYPLHAWVCEQCFLVQLDEFAAPETIFSDYAYFSSYSDSWLKHAEHYVEQMVERFHCDVQTQVIEIASNDGYLLDYFRRRAIPVLGVEPAVNVAEVAIAKGIPTRCAFLTEALAARLVEEGIQADILVANNVLAHVPHLLDFMGGLKRLLRKGGVLTIECPHLMSLLGGCQFDTIYHEHFSYFSFFSLERLLAQFDLVVFDVEELMTHGGSLRGYVCHREDKHRRHTQTLEQLREKERNFGIDSLVTYMDFSEKVKAMKRELLKFLIQAKQEGKKIACYGAPAKGNTLLNYCGIGTDFIDFTVDRNPHKQDKWLPGSHIPIYSPDRIMKEKPDYLWILPWNIQQEIQTQMAIIREWGGQFMICNPHVEVF
jgi:SAM-dependent methyltransferase